MLLLTDRIADSHRLKSVLGTLQTCNVLSLAEACKRPPVHPMIACDAALDDIESRESLSGALAHHRAQPNIPALFLLRDGDPDAAAVAVDLGATEVLPESASDDEIVASARRCIRGAMAARYGVINAGGAASGRVEDVGRHFAAMYLQAQQRKPVPVGVLRKGADTLVAAVKEVGIRKWLEVVKRYDDVTYQHCLLVAGLVTAFAARLGMTPERRHLMAQAALAHDLGKVDIPRDILKKTGALTIAEQKVMRTHPAVGHKLLSQTSGHDPVVLDVVLHHHEFLDGTGYPEGLRGDRLSELVRLTTICDIYAALIERRPYKAAMSRDDSRTILLGMAGRLDPALLRAPDSVIQDM